MLLKHSKYFMEYGGREKRRGKRQKSKKEGRDESRKERRNNFLVKKICD